MSTKVPITILLILGILNFLFGKPIMPQYEANIENIFIGQEDTANLRGAHQGKWIWSNFLRKEIRIDQYGTASWYGPGFYNRTMSNGYRYNAQKYTVAHPIYPFGTKLYIINSENGKSVVAEVTDRGPYVPPRIIDLSEKIAEDLGMKHGGLTKVHVSVLEKPIKF